MNKVSIEKISGGSDEVTVRRLALGDYAELLRAVKKLPQELTQFIDDSPESDLKDLDLKEFIPRFLPMLADSWDELAAVLAVPTDRDAEFFLKEVDLPDGLEVLTTALELNNYKRVVNAVKKLTARKTDSTQTQAEAPAQTSEAEPQEPKTT